MQHVVDDQIDQVDSNNRRSRAEKILSDFGMCYFFSIKEKCNGIRQVHRFILFTDEISTIPLEKKDFYQILYK